jgi:hypothetical protein
MFELTRCPKLSVQIGSAAHRKLVPIADGVGCRLSEEEQQLHEMTGLHVGAQRQRGSGRVIEQDAQGASRLPPPLRQRVIGQLPDRCFEMVLIARAASAEPCWRSGAQRDTLWCALQR